MIRPIYIVLFSFMLLGACSHKPKGQKEKVLKSLLQNPDQRLAIDDQFLRKSQRAHQKSGFASTDQQKLKP